jgi:predicted transcriptional regulator
MIKYISLTQKLVASPIPNSQKLLFGVLSVLTRKGTQNCTASNIFIGKMMGVKSESQVSNMLKGLKKEKFIEIKREEGRRQIILNTEKLVKHGYLANLRDK